MLYSDIQLYVNSFPVYPTALDTANQISFHFIHLKKKKNQEEHLPEYDNIDYVIVCWRK